MLRRSLLSAKTAKPVSKTYLYKEGDQCVALTGGWSYYDLGCGRHYINKDGCMYLQPARTEAGRFDTINSIDLTVYKKLWVDCSVEKRKWNDTADVLIKDTASGSTIFGLSSGRKAFDISNITGSHQIYVRANAESGEVKLSVSKIYLTE